MATPPDRPVRVAGVILAAGASSRLGRPKQLLDFGGQPLIRRVVRIALESRLDSVTVVLGAATDQIEPFLFDMDVAVVINPDFESGQASSMRAGLSSLSEDVEAVIFLLGDQPTMTAENVDAVITSFQGSGAEIVQARYAGGVSGHPVLFSRTLVPDLTSITGDEGARGVIRTHRDNVRYVDFDHEPPPDIDTSEDYTRVLKYLQSNYPSGEQ